MVKKSADTWDIAAVAGLALWTALSATSASAQDLKPLKAVATVKPIHALLQQVLGDQTKAGLIVDGTASPHTYALRPTDARLLNDADVVFRVSEALEPFTAKAIRSLPKSVDVVTLAEAPSLKLLPRRSGAMFEKHSEASHGGKGHGHGHAHSKKDTKDGGTDAHVWLDPDNAKAMVRHIAAVLSAKRPADKAMFEANAVKAVARIDVLDADLARDLKPMVNRPYIVFHDAYQYLEARYGLTAVGSITTNPEVPPSGKRLADLRKKVQGLEAVCVFAEPNFEGKVVASIIEGTAAKTAMLDPEGASLPSGPDLYDQLMRKLAAGVAGCLGK